MRIWTFGTDPQNVVVVTDPYVSARHCQVVEDDDGRFWVTDLGSTNGTYLVPNGESRYGPAAIRVVGRRQWREGMTLCLGRRAAIPRPT